MRPNFEEPLDTAKQLVEQDITLYDGPNAIMWKYFLLESSLPEFKKLGENFIVSEDWDHYFNLTAHNVMGAGTHAIMMAYINPYDLEYSEEYDILGRGWYRSKERIAGKYPFSGFLANKKWHLNEVIEEDLGYSETRL